jgi:CRP-like cAMP-binding protein
MRSELMGPLARFLLEKHRVRAVDPSELQEALEQAQSRTLEPGEQICVEGDEPDDVYILVQGHVSVTRRDASGASRQIAKLVAPALFGHMGLVDGSKRSASCEAIDDALVLVIPLEQWRRRSACFNRAGAALRRLLLASLSTQLAETNEAVCGMMDRGRIGSGMKEAAHPGRIHGEQLSLKDVTHIAAVLQGWTKSPGP